MEKSCSNINYKVSTTYNSDSYCINFVDEIINSINFSNLKSLGEELLNEALSVMHKWSDEYSVKKVNFLHLQYRTLNYEQYSYLRKKLNTRQQFCRLFNSILLKETFIDSEISADTKCNTDYILNILLEIFQVTDSLIQSVDRMFKYKVCTVDSKVKQYQNLLHDNITVLALIASRDEKSELLSSIYRYIELASKHESFNREGLFGVYNFLQHELLSLKEFFE